MEGFPLRLPIGKAAAAVTRFLSADLNASRCRYATAGLLSRLQGEQHTVYSLMQAAGCRVSIKDKDKDKDKNEAARNTSGALFVGKSPDKKRQLTCRGNQPLAQRFHSQAGYRRDIT